MSRNLIILILVFFLQSCSIVGLNDGYKSLTETNKDKVIRYSDTRERSDNVLLLVNHNDVLEIMTKDGFDYHIIYDYHPFCPSDVCISLDTFYRITGAYGNIKPLVISRFLDNVLFNELRTEEPLYSIDSRFYNTSYVTKYRSEFYGKLTNGIAGSIHTSNMFLFKNGKFLRCIDILAHENELNAEALDIERTIPYTKENPFEFSRK